MAECGIQWDADHPEAASLCACCSSHTTAQYLLLSVVPLLVAFPDVLLCSKLDMLVKQVYCSSSTVKLLHAQLR